MPRAVPVLVLGLAILGCAKRPPATVVPAVDVEPPASVLEPGHRESVVLAPTAEPPPPPSPTPVDLGRDVDEAPRPGGSIRVLVPAGPEASTLLGTLAAPERLFAEPDAWRVEGACRIVPVLGGAKAADVVDAWNDVLASGPGPLHWLLALGSARDQVRRGERLLTQADPRAQEGGVRFCGAGSLADLAARLDHPALRRALVGRVAVATRSPFLSTPDGGFVPDPDHVEGGPYVARVDSVDPGGAPALLFKLGDVDVAIVQGHDVRALEALPERVVLTQAPAREPTYFLWLHPEKRWLNATEFPFRAWLAGAIDRNEIVRLLFDGRGARAYTLHPDVGAAPQYELRPDLPLVPASRPQLTLRFDDGDPAEALLAARLRAELRTQRVDLQLQPTKPDRLIERLAAGDVEAALLLHRPETPDPVLALLGSVWWLGEAVRDETLALLDATALEDPAERVQAAVSVEEALLENARVCPLVRLESWLATRDGLVGVRVDPHGTLRLDAAWWRR